MQDIYVEPLQIILTPKLEKNNLYIILLGNISCLADT